MNLLQEIKKSPQYLYMQQKEELKKELSELIDEAMITESIFRDKLALKSELINHIEYKLGTKIQDFTWSANSSNANLVIDSSNSNLARGHLVSSQITTPIFTLENRGGLLRDTFAIEDITQYTNNTSNL